MLTKQNGGFKMLETIIIVVCAAVCIGAAAYAWWMENGPEKDDSDAAGKNSHSHAYTKYDSNIKDDVVFHKAHK